MNMKKIAALLTVGTMCAGMSLAFDAEAATREEIAQIKVNKSGKNFQYWNKDAASLKTLKDYVKDITNKKSANFVPVQERIAVFDMDGTLIGERSDTYTEWELYFDYMEKHPEKFSAEDRQVCAVAKKAVETKSVTDEIDAVRRDSQSRVFSGITDAEFNDIVLDFLQNPVHGFNNLKHGESFFLPMVEVVSYLKANDFKVFICSRC